MRKITLLALLSVIARFTAFGQIATPEMNRILTSAAQALSGMQFDPNSAITVRGRVTTLVWPEHSSGMILVEAEQSGEKYAFSTAGVPAMAKQGFTRFTLQPGTEVIVSGVVANGKPKIGPGFDAARADTISKADGTLVFDRSRLP